MALDGFLDCLPARPLIEMGIALASGRRVGFPALEIGKGGVLLLRERLSEVPRPHHVEVVDVILCEGAAAVLGGQMRACCQMRSCNQRELGRIKKLAQVEVHEYADAEACDIAAI